MKKILLAITLLITLSMHAQDELPTTEVRTLQNELVNFDQAFEPGKVTLVSFWATWCVPCKKEIANVKELLPKWEEEMGIDFFTVSIDDSRSSAKVASYAAAQRWDFPTYLDPNNDLKRSLNFQTVPFSMIVDGNGKIVYMHNGYEEGAENEIYEKLQEITASSAPAKEEVKEIEKIDISESDMKELREMNAKDNSKKPVLGGQKGLKKEKSKTE